MTEKSYLRADDVAEYLDISKSKAYKIIAALNSALKQDGYITIPGRINRAYFEERLYQPASIGR